MAGIAERDYKNRPNVSWGNAGVCLSGTACWDFHLLLFLEVLSPPGRWGRSAANLRAARRLAPWETAGTSGSDRLASALRCGFSVLCTFLLFFWSLSFDNRQRQLGTPREFFLHSSTSFFSSSCKKSSFIWLKLGQDFPNFLRGKNNLTNGGQD